jgi:hypothetical protein
MNRFRVPFGHNNILTCIAPVFDYICGFATAMAIRLDRNEPLNPKRYSLRQAVNRTLNETFTIDQPILISKHISAFSV